MSGWSIGVVKTGHARGRLEDVQDFIGGLYGPDLHAKRVDALTGATLGVMARASLAVSMIGQALAQGDFFGVFCPLYERRTQRGDL